MKLKYLIPVVLMSSMAVVGCSSDDDDDDSDGGSTTPASSTSGSPDVAVTNDNAQDLAIAATEAADEAINGEDVGDLPALGGRAAARLVAQVPDLDNLDIDLGDICIPSFTSSGNSFTYDYSSCPDYSGSVTATFSPGLSNWTSYTADYSNFSFSGINGYNGSVTCTRSSTGADATITCGSTVNGLDGGTYVVRNSSVSGNSSSGYTVNATVTRNGRGTFTIEASGLTYGSCALGVPNSGSITFTGTGGTSGSITYDSCDSATVVVGGTSTVITWADVAA